MRPIHPIKSQGNCGEVMVLHDAEDLPTLDIAETLGIEAPAVKPLVQRPRLFMRKRLSAHFERSRGPAWTVAAARRLLTMEPAPV